VVRLKQILIVAVGLVLAGAMVVLGVWQLDVYRSQGDSTAAARAAAPPLALAQVAPVGTAVSVGFGHSVRFEGRYDPSLQILVPVDGDAGAFRVLSALRQSDSSIVPVVRGLVRTGVAPSPPVGDLSQVGVLLPSEDDAPLTASDTTQLNAVRLPALAQRWSGQLIGGFVTLSDADARAQGLTPAPVSLPQAKGRLRNGAYAFQWWLFGAFAVAMAVRMARDFGLRDDLESGEIEQRIHNNAT
jgi:surfeit locus 1 family protein